MLSALKSPLRRLVAARRVVCCFIAFFLPHLLPRLPLENTVVIWGICLAFKPQRCRRNVCTGRFHRRSRGAVLSAAASGLPAALCAGWLCGPTVAAARRPLRSARRRQRRSGRRPLRAIPAATGRPRLSRFVQWIAAAAGSDLRRF